MLVKSTLSIILTIGFALSCVAQEETATSKPVELEEVIKASVGVWDAEIEVWPQGLESPSITFKGVETNRAYGAHWLSSDFDSEFMGQTMKIHSIVGYDLDQKKLVGKVVDHGPYAATMTGEYDAESKTVTWMTEAKDVSGNPLLQKTTITQKSDTERVLVLQVPGEEEGEFNKFMQIVFTKRE